MDRKNFFGTPLSRVLNNDNEGTSTEGPINARRARSDQQQMVRDEKGRRRFHGAFTGGFSAGYFNSVDTVQGFKPREFISHRGSKRTDIHQPNLLHKPEDYMDEEDMSEFGIAPKKIRVNEHYSHPIDASLRVRQCSDQSLIELLQPVKISIGEKILRLMNTRYVAGTIDHNLGAKHDLHGLGYKPIKLRFLPTIANPLKATLGQCKRLEITGEAFGSGVLEEDDDILDNLDSYGRDNMDNYQSCIGSSNKTQAYESNRPDWKSKDSDCAQVIPGFVLTTRTKLCDYECDNRNTINIPHDWTVPSRQDPYIPPTKLRLMTSEFHQVGKLEKNLFGEKFTGGSTLQNEDIIESKSGLLSYHDLKASELVNKIPLDLKTTENNAERVTLKREVLEWHPCSLLCKRFSVQNPYPDSTFCGVNENNEHQELPSEADFGHTVQPEQHNLALIELRRAIFNVVFDNHDDKIGTSAHVYEDCCEDGDDPQFVDDSIVIEDDNNDRLVNVSDEDSDIVVVPATRSQPELIVISSSSTSPEPVEIDTYGPPLPPDLDRDWKSETPAYQSSSRRKDKKHKRHKRYRQ